MASSANADSTAAPGTAAPAVGGPTWYLPFTKEATPELHLADGWLLAVPPTEVGEREPD